MERTLILVLALVLATPLPACDGAAPETQTGDVGDSNWETGQEVGTTTAYVSAFGETATWNTTTHRVENVQGVEYVGAEYTLTGPEELTLSGLTVDHPELEIDEWQALYTFTVDGLTLSGSVEADLEETDDLSGVLGPSATLNGTELSCTSDKYDPFSTTLIVNADGSIQADGIATGSGEFRPVGPVLYKYGDEGRYDPAVTLGLITDKLYYMSHNDNVGDYHIECSY